MTGFLSGLWVVLGLELRQRVRGLAWYILLGVFVALVAAVTGLLWLSLGTLGASVGGGIFSSLIYFVLLLGTLVAPALSGGAINGDRDAGTLATTQVTLVTTGQIVLGKFLAAWITALAFLAAATPFLLIAVALGELEAGTILVSVLVLAAELGVVAAIGVGLSGVITRPLFSVVTTYLVVAALSIGTLIAFTLGGLVSQSTARSVHIGIAQPGFDGSLEDIECGPPVVTQYSVPRFDYYWGVLSANPYVVLADASPTNYDRYGNPQDLFGFVKTGVRQAQLAPELESVYDECAIARAGYQQDPEERPTSEEIVASTVPSWFVGLAIHLVLAAGALAWAWARIRTPARRLARGSRVA